MNKTKIEWTDYTWNPVTGCWGPGGTAEKPKRCAYCYAVKVARRFICPYPGTNDSFYPYFHEDRLSQPAKVKKRSKSKIFVCSMADLLGDWVPREQIEQVIDAGPVRAPWHTYQFLTKNPRRLKDFNPWPSNCWVGTTITNQADADERLPWLLEVDAPVLFVSHEPLLGKTHIWSHWLAENNPVPNPVPPECQRRERGINWAIIGAMTGPGAVRPDLNWTLDLIKQYQSAGIPVFCKDNLEMPVGMKRIQEYPRDPRPLLS